MKMIEVKDLNASMLQEQAVVEAVDQDVLTLRLGQPAACNGCGGNGSVVKACQAFRFFPAPQASSLQLYLTPVQQQWNLQVGDRVMLQLPASRLLAWVFGVYGVPLLLALASVILVSLFGAWLGWSSGLTDLVSAGAFFGALFGAVRRFKRLSAKRSILSDLDIQPH